MVNLRSPDLDMEKISESGQCFRLIPTAPQHYRLIARGRVLHIRALCGGAALNCTRPEFDAVWRDYFDLDTDYAAFRAAVPAEDAYLSAAVRAGQGIRILRQDPWEMLVTFLISQRKNIPAIRRCVEALCSRCGQPLEGGVYAFPTPEALSGLEDDALCACSLGYRTGYVRTAARRAAAGALDGLEALDDEELRRRLLVFPGVGPKVADCILLFGYHRLGGFPRDVWINRVVDEVYGGRFPLERYAGFEGVIQQYLFFYARSGRHSAGE
jgi:N-glycosylase/DNA lyase